MYLGTREGSLRVFDAEDCRFTPFELGFHLLHPSQRASSVVDMSASPCRPEKLLLVFESSPPAVWNLSKSKLLYTIGVKEAAHCAAWSEDGGNIVIGLRSGCLALWRCSGKSPFLFKMIRPDPNVEDILVTAVCNLMWLHTFIVVQGGQPFDKSDQLSVLGGDDLNVIQQVCLPQGKKAMRVVYSPIREGELVREHFLVLTEEADLLVYDFQGLYAHYVDGIFGPSNVLCSQLVTVAGERVKTILLTAHLPGLVRFWTLQADEIRNTANLCLGKEEDHPYFRNSNIIYAGLNCDPQSKVSALFFQRETGRLAVGFALGSVGLWDSALDLLFVNDLHESPILSLLIYKDFLISGDLYATFQVFDIASETSILRTDLRVNEQYISITKVKVIENSLLVVMSNGCVQIRELEGFQITHENVSPHCDVDSKVPRRSDVGIVKIIKCIVNSDTMVLCYERKLFRLNGQMVTNSRTLENSIVSASLFLFRNEEFVNILYNDGTFELLTIPTLDPVWSGAMNLKITPKHLHMSLDGRFVMITMTKQMVTGWLSFEIEEPQDTKIEFVPVETPVERRKKNFLGFRSSFCASQACNVYVVERPSRKCTHDYD